jgi:hypothetical protein
MGSTAAPTASEAATGGPVAWLRWIVVASQAATIGITWPLWQVRLDPPLLPLWPMPALPFGGALLATLAVALVRPRLGAALHAALLLLSIVADQTREQPQVLSLALLLCVTASTRLRAIGALHLAALWFWSGLGKLLSPRFLGEGGTWLLGGSVAAGSATAFTAAAALGAGELALGVLALGARTRRVAAVLGALLHASILLHLVLRGANPAVWPWNAALAAAAPLLLGRTGGSILPWGRCGGVVRWCAPLFLLLPLGYHAGLVDRAFAHSVYTLDGPRAVLLWADGRVEERRELPALRVPLPPVPRVLEAFFVATARPGDALAILEGRPLARLLGARDRMLRTPPAAGDRP